MNRIERLTDCIDKYDADLLEALEKDVDEEIKRYKGELLNPGALSPQMATSSIYKWDYMNDLLGYKIAIDYIKGKGGPIEEVYRRTVTSLEPTGLKPIDAGTR